MAIEGMPDRKLTRANGRRRERGERARAGRRRPIPTSGSRDMALDGVVAEVIYPTFGLFIDMIPAADLADGVRAGLQRLARRVVPAPARRVHPRRGRAGARRRVGDGRDGACRRARLQGRDDPDVAARRRCRTTGRDYDPLWKIAADAGMPLSLHTGTGALPQHERGSGWRGRSTTPRSGCSRPRRCATSRASGVLERHPQLRLVFVETGAGWFAYCCERMDEAFEEHEQWVKPEARSIRRATTPRRSVT